MLMSVSECMSTCFVLEFVTVRVTVCEMSVRACVMSVMGEHAHAHGHSHTALAGRLRPHLLPPHLTAPVLCSPPGASAGQRAQ